MKVKVQGIVKGLLVAVLMLFNCSIHAQPEDEINKIAALLQEELSKAGVSISRSAIQLATVSEQDQKKYHLDHKPADAFFIKVDNRSLDIRSLSVNGLRNGIYWYLHFLGFRFYFPGEAWQYKPRLETAFKSVEKTIAPAFSHRRIWYAYGTGSVKADKDYKEWVDANLLGGEEVNAGHSYDGIVNRNKPIFLEHPEYFAQKVAKGKIPPGPKFEPGNEELVQLLIADALQQIETRRKKNRQLPVMISMDPSDGGGFSTSASAMKIGGPSEQTFYLANRVAKAIRAKYPSVKIGLYAYNFHAAPPKFELEPNIVVLVATAMNQSAFRTDELIELWQKKNIEVGVRDYFGVMAWDWDMPGKVKGGKLDYIKQLINYYKKGVRFFTAETNIGWISRGLGHFAAARVLWNIDADIDEIEREFYSTMFGKAATEMKKLFQSWQDYKPAVPLDGDLYQWSKWVEAAGKAENDSHVQRRIDQVKQYLHYVVLFKQWKEQSTDANLVELLEYAYRVQDDGIVASYPLSRRLANAAVLGKKNMRFNDPQALWKRNNKSLTKTEIDQDFYSDLNSLNRSEKAIVTKLPQAYKIKREAKTSNKTDKGSISSTTKLRGVHKIIFQIHRKDASSINLSAGLIKSKQFKTLRLAVYPYDAELKMDEGAALLKEVVQPKQPIKPIALDRLDPGPYIAFIDDARDGFTLSFSGPVSYAIMAGNENSAWTFGRNNLVFEVGDTKEFTVKNDGALTLVSPKGRIVDLQKQKGTFKISVQKGEEGVWKMQRQSGRFHLEGLLPFVSSSPEFLLLNED